MSPTQTPPVHYQHPRRLVWVSTLRPSPRVEGFGCREYSFEAHLCGSYVRCDLPVRLHACSPPRLAATQLARSSVRNRLIALAGLSPALTPASRAHQLLNVDRKSAAVNKIKQTWTATALSADTRQGSHIDRNKSGATDRLRAACCRDAFQRIRRAYGGLGSHINYPNLRDSKLSTSASGVTR